MKRRKNSRKPPYVRGSETSEAAADSMAELAGGYESLVFDFIDQQSQLFGTDGFQLGSTADEATHRLRLTHQNGSARVSTLAQKGLIVRTERKRITRSGRSAFVYVSATQDQAELPL